MLSEQEKEILNRADILIEGDNAIWHLHDEGLIKGTYIGTFKFRCYLSPTHQIAANREYRELLGPNPALADQHETFLAYALTQLKYRVLESPPFWTSLSASTFNGDIPDDNILSLILDAAISSELKYKSLLKKKKEDALNRAKKALEKTLMSSPNRKKEQSEDEIDEELPKELE